MLYPLTTLFYLVSVDCATAVYFNSPRFFKPPPKRTRQRILIDEKVHDLPHCEVTLKRLDDKTIEKYKRRQVVMDVTAKNNEINDQPGIDMDSKDSQVREVLNATQESESNKVDDSDCVELNNERDQDKVKMTKAADSHIMHGQDGEKNGECDPSLHLTTGTVTVGTEIGGNAAIVGDSADLTSTGCRQVAGSQPPALLSPAGDACSDLDHQKTDTCGQTKHECTQNQLPVNASQESVECCAETGHISLRKSCETGERNIDNCVDNKDKDSDLFADALTKLKELETLGKTVRGNCSENSSRSQSPGKTCVNHRVGETATSIPDKNNTLTVQSDRADENEAERNENVDEADIGETLKKLKELGDIMNSGSGKDEPSTSLSVQRNSSETKTQLTSSKPCLANLLTQPQPQRSHDTEKTNSIETDETDKHSTKSKPAFSTSESLPCSLTNTASQPQLPDDVSDSERRQDDTHGHETSSINGKTCLGVDSLPISSVGNIYDRAQTVENKSDANKNQNGDESLTDNDMLRTKQSQPELNQSSVADAVQHSSDLSIGKDGSRDENRELKKIIQSNDLHTNAKEDRVVAKMKSDMDTVCKEFEGNTSDVGKMKCEKKEVNQDESKKFLNARTLSVTEWEDTQKESKVGGAINGKDSESKCSDLKTEEKSQSGLKNEVTGDIECMRSLYEEEDYAKTKMNTEDDLKCKSLIETSNNVKNQKELLSEKLTLFEAPNVNNLKLENLVNTEKSTTSSTEQSTQTSLSSKITPIKPIKTLREQLMSPVLNTPKLPLLLPAPPRPPVSIVTIPAQIGVSSEVLKPKSQPSVITIAPKASVSTKTSMVRT